MLKRSGLEVDNEKMLSATKLGLVNVTVCVNGKLPVPLLLKFSVAGLTTGGVTTPKPLRNTL